MASQTVRVIPRMSAYQLSIYFHVRRIAFQLEFGSANGVRYRQRIVSAICFAYFLCKCVCGM